MKFCTKCGVQNDDESTFCAGCGAAIGAAAPVRQAYITAPPYYIDKMKTRRFDALTLENGVLILNGFSRESGKITFEWNNKNAELMLSRTSDNRIRLSVKGGGKNINVYETNTRNAFEFIHSLVMWGYKTESAEETLAFLLDKDPSLKISEGKTANIASTAYSITVGIVLLGVFLLSFFEMKSALDGIAPHLAKSFDMSLCWVFAATFAIATVGEIAWALSPFGNCHNRKTLNASFRTIYCSCIGYFAFFIYVGVTFLTLLEKPLIIPWVGAFGAVLFFISSIMMKKKFSASLSD